ncbi:MAG: biotin/lipoyl-containing protein [Planctomycetota bacterium]
MKYQIEWADQQANLEAHCDPTGRDWTFALPDGSELKARVDVIEEGTVLRMISHGETRTITLLPGNQIGSPLRFLLDHEPMELGVLDPVDLITREVSGSGAGSGLISVESVMPGIVRKVLVNEGETVETGQPLLLLEAMKMENEIAAPDSGVISLVKVAAGETVAAGSLLVQIQKED